MEGLSTGRLLISAAVGYAGASYFSYRYNQMTKAHSDLKDIKDKKLYLHDLHDKSAEKYDSNMVRREYSNKISKYRRIV